LCYPNVKYDTEGVPSSAVRAQEVKSVKDLHQEQAAAAVQQIQQHFVLHHQPSTIRDAFIYMYKVSQLNHLQYTRSSLKRTSRLFFLLCSLT